jgi:hypothetical protein
VPLNVLAVFVPAGGFAEATSGRATTATARLPAMATATATALDTRCNYLLLC